MKISVLVLPDIEELSGEEAAAVLALRFCCATSIHGETDR